MFLCSWRVRQWADTGAVQQGTDPQVRIWLGFIGTGRLSTTTHSLAKGYVTEVSLGTSSSPALTRQLVTVRTHQST